jgi:hypothetical protein
MDLSAMGILTIRTEVQKMHNTNNDAVFNVRGSVNNAFVVAHEFKRMRHAVEIRENGEATSFWICHIPSEIYTIISDRSCIDRCLRCLSNENLKYINIKCSGSRIELAWMVVRSAVTQGFSMDTECHTDLERSVTIHLRRKHSAILPVNLASDALMRLSLDDNSDLSMTM